jgi:hypothetical protein
MVRGRAVPVAVLCVAVVSAGCGSGSSSPSMTAPEPLAAAAPSAGQTVSTFEARVLQDVRGLSKAAVVDGFRVHPDPGDDGVIRAFEGQPVIVNAADIASVPPAPETFLVVSWGDGDGNQRLGCGPCRLEHVYASGRYTLVATADDLQPEGRPGRVNRSITLTIEVTPGPSGQQAAISPLADFGFRPTRLAVGDFGEIFFPNAVMTALDSLILHCTTEPVLPFDVAPVVVPVPGGVAIPIQAVLPARCTFTVRSHDADGNVFRDSSTLVITP